jgi:hypothetical protein
VLRRVVRNPQGTYRHPVPYHPLGLFRYRLSDYDAPKE